MAAPAKLNLDLILDEAIALLQEDGLDDITLRKLATRLDVEAPSLYRHVAGKQQLLALMAVRLFHDQIEAIGDCASWQQWLSQFGRTLWATQHRIGDVARLVLTTEFDPDQLIAMTEWPRDILARHGIDAPTALEMQIAVQSMVLGLSGLAGAASGGSLQKLVPFDAILEQALASLVTGWETRLNAARADRGRRPKAEPAAVKEHPPTERLIP
ncbi:TetR family transcriptional regulator [Sphingopyxis sp. GC21]|uniref:TetR family transcriptional regulator n=1 Tax=Sphingopyxis sp. GC21 TaxID=2933562 RepID=UPI0021E50970|nr:TetR/AcrR family transcriptional regulator [Sphingopyxis sp. GC21]